MAKTESVPTLKRISADTAPAPRREKPKARKCTFMISDLNDIRLSAYARKLSRDRSRVVDDALSRLFHGMRIAFPGDQESKDEAVA